MLILLLVVGLLFGFSRWLLRSTPVSIDQAVEQFREQKASVQASAAPSASAGATTTPAPSPPATPAVRLVSEGRAPAGALTLPEMFRPAEGTYTYDAEGEEGLPGWRRDLSGETFRNVIHHGPNAWMDHHMFRKQRQIWTVYGQDDRGRIVTSTRNYIGFGDPEVVTLDETVTFSPPLRGAMLPWREGKRWRGEFGGDTYGTYEAGTTKHGFMEIGGTRVEYWLDEIDIRLQGEIHGRVQVKRWFSPKFGLVLREEYDADAEKGPLTYRARWSVTLRSLTPRR